MLLVVLDQFDGLVTIAEQKSSNDRQRTLLFLYASTPSDSADAVQTNPWNSRTQNPEAAPPKSSGQAGRAAEKSKLGSVKCSHPFLTLDASRTVASVTAEDCVCRCSPTDAPGVSRFADRIEITIR